MTLEDNPGDTFLAGQSNQSGKSALLTVLEKYCKYYNKNDVLPPLSYTLPNDKSDIGIVFLLNVNSSFTMLKKNTNKWYRVENLQSVERVQVWCNCATLESIW